jgi:hypothetical protein
MKTVTRLHFSRFAQAVRVSVLIVVVAALAVVMIVGARHRTDDSWPSGNDRNAPSEQQSHYNFPTYA